MRWSMYVSICRWSIYQLSVGGPFLFPFSLANFFSFGLATVTCGVAMGFIGKFRIHLELHKQYS